MNTKISEKYLRKMASVKKADADKGIGIMGVPETNKFVEESNINIVALLENIEDQARMAENQLRVMINKAAKNKEFSRINYLRDILQDMNNRISIIHELQDDCTVLDEYINLLIKEESIYLSTIDNLKLNMR